MGIWHKQVVRLNGDLMAYIEHQDDWTGRITKHIRAIKLDGNTYYCNFMGQRVTVNAEREDFTHEEETNKIARDWYRKTKF